VVCVLDLVKYVSISIEAFVIYSALTTFHQALSTIISWLDLQTKTDIVTSP